MAIALVSNNRGTLTTTPAGLSVAIDMPAAASITVGNTLILSCAYDNSGALGVDPNMNITNGGSGAGLVYGVDLRGNLWWRLAKAVRSSGAQNDGSIADIWACRVTNAYTNGDDLTVVFSSTQSAVAFSISEFSGINPRSYSVVTPITGTGNSAAGIGPTGTITPTATGQLVVGLAAIETNTAITGDPDTTNGSWVTVANAVANTGTDATSQTAFAQYKITTGTSAQDWDVSKTGASDWAALAVVFDVFTNVANPFISGNPNYPCIAGAEVLPLNYEQLPIDTGTEYLQTHQIYPNSYGTQNYQAATLALFDVSGLGTPITQHTIINEVYLEGSDTVSDETFHQQLFLVAAGVGGGASVSSGSAADALASIGGAYVTLPNNGYVDVLFNPDVLTSLFPYYRIVNWGINYLAWKDDSSAPGPGEGIKVEWRDSGANNGAGSSSIIGAWLVQNYKRDAQFEKRWIGETNPIIRGKGEIFPQNAPYNASFTINDLSHMATGDQTTRLRIYGAQGADSSQATVYLDYIIAFVNLVPERRLGHGTRQISLAPAVSANPWYTAALGQTSMWSPLNTNNRWQVPAAANTYVLATREALPASPSDYYAAQVSTAAGSIARSVGSNEAVGPSFVLRAVTQPRATLHNATDTGQPILRRAIMDDGVLVGIPEELESFIISVASIDLLRWATDGSFFPAYDFGGVGGDYSEIYTASDIVDGILVPGGQQYSRVKVLVYPDELTTANLTITVEQPISTVLATTILTVADALASPDVGNGWREISLPLSVAVTPSAGQAAIRFSSTTPQTAPWRIALANGLDGRDRFGYYPSVDQVDWAAVLQCPLASPGVSLGTQSIPMTNPEGSCLSDSIDLPEVSISNSSDYDWIRIDRSSLDGGWTTIALIEDPAPGLSYLDTGVSWDQPSGSIAYRVTGYRNADHLTVETISAGWTGTATAPGVAFGLAVDQALFVYVPTFEGETNVVWNPLNPVSMMPLLGVDYQIPIRAPEERGLEISFLTLVQKFLCTDPEQWSMSPTPFDTIRGLSRQERLELLLPGGYNRFVTLNLGGLTVRTEKGIYLADVTLTDVVTPVEDPWS